VIDRWGDRVTGLNVLLVEDDEAISGPLKRGLRREGYSVRLLGDGPRALSAGLDPAVGLVVLDVGLPGMDGLEVCRLLRSARPKLQILLLTVRPEEAHAVDGLDAGADDYIAQPFRFAEVLARIRAAARRTTVHRYSAHGIHVELRSRRAFIGDLELDLSPKEFDLLARLIVDAGELVTREQLFRDVWQTSCQPNSRTLDQHVSWLRGKIGEDLIITVRGRGFRFRGDAE
jgi:DNA-binding response OmpR family regulator